MGGARRCALLRRGRGAGDPAQFLELLLPNQPRAAGPILLAVVPVLVAISFFAMRFPRALRD